MYSNKLITLLVMLIASVASGIPVEAAETQHGPTLSTNIALASQYVARGFQQSWGNPALQGGIDYAHPNGFFAGTWISSVSPRYIQDGYIEWDIYTGYGRTVGPVSLTTALYFYIYPDAALRGALTASGNPVKYNFGELLVGVAWKWISVKYHYTYTRDYFANNGDTLFDDTGRFYANGKHSRGSGYLDVSLSYDFGGGYAGLLHYGYQRVRNFPDWDSADYKVGFTKSFDSLLGTKGWSASVNYTGVTKTNDYFKNQNAAVPFVSLTGDGSTSNPVGNHLYITVGRVF